MEMNGKECVRYISCDITEYECTPKLPKTPHQYLITLNPILTIHNLIPAILNITVIILALYIYIYILLSKR